MSPSLSDRARAAEIRRTLAASTSESELQATVCDTLDLLGWRWHHETDSRRSPSGWPDLFAVHPDTGWVLWLELKSTTGQISQAQVDWLDALTRAMDHEREQLTRGWVCVRAPRIVGLIYPADLDQLLTLLGNASR